MHGKDDEQNQKLTSNEWAKFLANKKNGHKMVLNFQFYFKQYFETQLNIKHKRYFVTEPTIQSILKKSKLLNITREKVKPQNYNCKNLKSQLVQKKKCSQFNANTYN